MNTRIDEFASEQIERAENRSGLAAKGEMKDVTDKSDDAVVQNFIVFTISR